MKVRLLSLALIAGLAGLALSEPPRTTSNELVPGLRYSVTSKGTTASETRYRIQLGTFHRQTEADAALADLKANGFEAALEATGSAYRLYSLGLPTEEEAESLRQRLSSHGYKVADQIEALTQDLTNPEGPWRIHVLEADPRKIRVEVAHAYDAVIGLETTADLAARHGALAAVNGGYFRMRGLLAGDNQGALRIDGRLLSEPDRGRATVGFYEAGGVTRALFGRLAFRGEIRFGDRTAVPLDGINRSREDTEIILFTPEFHRTTLTSPGGAEVVVEEGRITAVRDGAGSSVIPPSGTVISVGRDRLEGIRPHLEPGSPVSVDTEVVPLLPDPDSEWDRAEDIIGAGPLLVWNGKRLEEPEKESMSQVFFLARHPRTAVGVKEDGTLVFVVVDGRQPHESVGMSLPELTDLMLELGCVSAINLDGGGSSTMVIDDEIVNTPSGGSPRQNADGILLFPAAPGSASR